MHQKVQALTREAARDKLYDENGDICIRSIEPISPNDGDQRPMAAK